MEENKYEGFSLAMALVDAIPVIFFGLSCIVIGIIFKSPLFIIGAVLCFVGGVMKVSWKMVLALKKKDVVFLNKQFRYTMIAGFLLIIISLIAGWSRISFSSIISSVTSFPQVIFFALWLVGLICMGVLGKKLDSRVARNNWIEQCVNSVAQISMFIALLMCR